MKHYEMILSYSFRIISKEEKEIVVKKKRYGLINFDERMDENERIEYPTFKIESKDISYGRIQEAIRVINSFLQKINTESNAICLTNIDEKYLTFIGVTKSDNKYDIENLLNMTYEYLQKNASGLLIKKGYYDDDDEIKTVDLSEKFIYKEISAKEFLIDNVYELVNESDNSVIIQNYFKSLNEHNYNVRDLGYRKDTLNYDFNKRDGGFDFSVRAVFALFFYLQNVKKSVKI